MVWSYEDVARSCWTPCVAYQNTFTIYIGQMSKPFKTIVTSHSADWYIRRPNNSWWKSYETVPISCVTVVFHPPFFSTTKQGFHERPLGTLKGTPCPKVLNPTIDSYPKGANIPQILNIIRIIKYYIYYIICTYQCWFMSGSHVYLEETSQA